MDQPGAAGDQPRPSRWRDVCLGVGVLALLHLVLQLPLRWVMPPYRESLGCIVECNRPGLRQAASAVVLDPIFLLPITQGLYLAPALIIVGVVALITRRWGLVVGVLLGAVLSFLIGGAIFLAAIFRAVDEGCRCVGR